MVQRIPVMALFAYLLGSNFVACETRDEDIVNVIYRCRVFRSIDILAA